MNADQKAFLDAEETAEQLVTTLAKLKSEIESFDTAKKDLSAVRSKLEQLIAAFSSIGEDTKAVVENLKRIGGPELMDRITKSQKALEDRLSQTEETIRRRTGKLQVLIILVGLVALAAAVFAILPFVR